MGSFNDPVGPFYISSVKDACKDLAEYSTQYSMSIFEELMESGTSFPSLWDDEVYQYTHDCMYETGGYTRGLVNEFYDYEW